MSGDKAASYYHEHHPMIAGDPEMEALVRSVKNANKARLQGPKQARFAEAARQKRLNTLYMANIDEAIDTPGQKGPAELAGKDRTAGYQSDIRKFGFSSKTMPDFRGTFKKSVDKHYPALISGLATDLLGKQKSASGKELIGKWSAKELSKGSRRNIEGLLFEEFIKGMSTLQGDGPETGKESVDLQRWKIDKDFSGLFTKDMPLTDLELKRTYYKSKEARGKMSGYEKEVGSPYEDKYRRTFLGHVPNYLIPTSDLFVPNFYQSELKKARDREINGLMDRGDSFQEAKSKVYAAKHPKITSNSDHIGIFNSEDEPRGPQQGIDRAVSEGKSISFYGRKFSGNIPNFLDTGDDEEDGWFTKRRKQVEQKFTSGTGVLGAVGAKVEGMGGIGIVPKVMKELNREAKELAKVLKDADSSMDELAAATQALDRIDEQRIDILGDQANTLNEANRAGTGTTAKTATAGTKGKGVGGIESGRLEEAREDQQSDLLQKTFLISTSLGVIEQLAPELEGLTRTASAVTNTFSTVSQVLPGTTGKVVAGMAATVVGLEQAKTAIFDWAYDVKGIAKRAQQSQDRFTKLNDSISQYTSVFDQLTTAAKDSSTPFETLSRLQDKLGNLLANMPEDVGDRLAEATSIQDLKDTGESMRQAEELKNARAQLAATLVKLNAEAEAGVLSFLMIKDDAFTRSGGMRGGDLTESDKIQNADLGRQIIGSLSMFDQTTGKLITGFDAIRQGLITPETFQGNEKDVMKNLKAAGFRPEDLAPLEKAFATWDDQAIEDMNKSMSEQTGLIKERAKAAAEASVLINKQIEAEKKAAKALKDATEVWRQASDAFASALNFQMELKDMGKQSGRRGGLAEVGAENKISSRFLGLRGKDLEHGVKQQEIMNQAVTKSEDAARKTRNDQLAAIIKRVETAMENSNVEQEQDKLRGIGDEMRDFFSRNQDKDSKSFMIQLEQKLEQMRTQGGGTGGLNFDAVRNEMRDLHNTLKQDNVKNLSKMEEELKIAELNWKTNKEIAKNSQMVKSTGGIDAYLDPSK